MQIIQLPMPVLNNSCSTLTYDVEDEWERDDSQKSLVERIDWAHGFPSPLYIIRIVNNLDP